MWCTSAQPASARRLETRWRFHLSRCPDFGVHFWWTDDQEEPFLNNSGLNQAKLLIQDRFRQSMKWWGWVIATIVGMAIGIRSLLVE